MKITDAAVIASLMMVATARWQQVIRDEKVQ